MTRKLTEEEKIRIIELVDEYGRQWKLIGEIVGKHPNTCQSFYLSYSKYHTINLTIGRPITIDQNKKKMKLCHQLMKSQIKLSEKWLLISKYHILA